MLNELFAHEAFDAANSGQYATAIQKVRQEINTKLVQNVFKGTFRSGKGVLASVAKWLSSITVGYVKDSWARRKNKKNTDNASEKQMENFFEMHKSRFQELLKDLIASLQTGIGNLPQEHFDEIKNKLFAELHLREAT